MNEFNFFEAYYNKKNSKSNYKLIIFIILISLAFISLFYYYYDLNQKKTAMISDIEYTESIINEPERQKDFKKVSELVDVNAEMKNILDEIEVSVLYLDNAFKINKTLITNVIYEIPVNTYIKLIDFKDPLINITCISDSYESAAQYIYNLKSSGNDYSNVFMPAINLDDGDYEYNISIEMGGDEDENVK